MSRQKTIFHIDADQFFVAVQLREKPYLRGKAVVVGGGPRGRGVVTSASYEARRYGLHAGMPIYEAMKLCPHAVFLPTGDCDYVGVSNRIFFDILREFTDHIYVPSIDEAYVDVTDALKLWGGVEAMAMKIKRRVFESEKITVTIGAGANCRVAKIAGGMQKPDGFVYLPPAIAAQALRNLPVGDLIGVGYATQRKLKLLGIETAGQLAEYPADLLRKIFGVYGPQLQATARGEGDDTVLKPEELPAEKSMGHCRTFWKDYTDPSGILAEVHHLCEKVARRLRKRGMAGRVITLTIRYHGFETVVHGHKFKHPIQHETDIYSAAVNLFHQLYEPRRPVRLAGVTASELLFVDDIVQEELFHPFIGVGMRNLGKAFDGIKNKYGEAAIGYLSSLMRTSVAKEERLDQKISVIPMNTRFLQPGEDAVNEIIERQTTRQMEQYYD